MKSVYLSLCLFLLSSCVVAEEPPSKPPKMSLLFSPGFSVQLPLDVMENSTVINFEGIWIKFENNAELSGIIIMNGEDSLPEGYDIRKFPRYLFGLDKLNSLPPKFQKIFESKHPELSNITNKKDVITYSDDSKTYYHACSDKECESYIVKKNNKDQILALFSKGLDLEFIKSITKGIK